MLLDVWFVFLLLLLILLHIVLLVLLLFWFGGRGGGGGVGGVDLKSTYASRKQPARTIRFRFRGCMAGLKHAHQEQRAPVRPLALCNAKILNLSNSLEPS